MGRQSPCPQEAAVLLEGTGDTEINILLVSHSAKSYEGIESSVKDLGITGREIQLSEPQTFGKLSPRQRRQQAQQGRLTSGSSIEL